MGFSIPLYFMLTVECGVASMLMLPSPLYKPAAALCVFITRNAMARTCVNTVAGVMMLMLIAPAYEFWNARCLLHLS